MSDQQRRVKAHLHAVIQRISHKVGTLDRIGRNRRKGRKFSLAQKGLAVVSGGNQNGFVPRFL